MFSDDSASKYDGDMYSTALIPELYGDLIQIGTVCVKGVHVVFMGFQTPARNMIVCDHYACRLACIDVAVLHELKYCLFKFRFCALYH